MKSPNSFESAGLSAEDRIYTRINADDPVDLAVATYSDLGFVADKGQARETFGVMFDELSEALYADKAGRGADLVIVPKFESPANGGLQLAELLYRYDELSRDKGNLASGKGLGRSWSMYSAEELNQGQANDLEAQAVLLDGESDYGEKGLYYTSKTIKEQRQLLGEQKAVYKKNTTGETQLNSVNIASYIIRNAMQIERGEPLQDIRTLTRFPELDTKYLGRSRTLPVILSADCLAPSKMRIGTQNAETNSDHYGVRLSIGLAR